MLRRYAVLLLFFALVSSSFVAYAQDSGVAPLSPARRAQSQSLLRGLGLLGPNTPFTRAMINRSVAPPENVTVSQTRATGQLTFQYDGFGPDTANLTAYRDKAYPLMVQVYGEPAPAQRGRVVRIIKDANAGDGVYSPIPTPDASGGTIRLSPVTTADGYTSTQAKDVNNFLLTVLMLNAFHGAQIFDYDSWELGFSHAAALAVTYEVKNRPANFDPTYYAGYLLPVYDFFNRPDIAGRIHYAPGLAPNLGFYRNGLAQAAWLKVWVENPNFFKNFNASYYQKAGTGTALAKDVRALRAIAAAQVPQGKVEGLAFEDWYRHQYILDTSIRTGEKMWFGILPYPNLTDGDTRSVFFGVLQRYKTNPNGSEVPVGGQGTATAFNELGQDITQLSAELKADNRVIFSSEGEAEMNLQNISNPDNEIPIIGFTSTGTGTPVPPNQSRVTIVVRTGTNEVANYFPYNVAGTEPDNTGKGPAGFFGATLGAENGKVSVATTGITTTQVDLKRGAFGVPVKYPSRPAVKISFTVTPSGGSPVSSVRNASWLSADLGGLAVLLEARPATATGTATLKLASNNKLRMFSVPLYPEQSDEARALGADPATLFMARYRPTLTGAFNGKFTFGFGTGRYDVYPNLVPPLGPGRGYWVRLAEKETTYNVRGTPPPNTPFEVPLLGGWNQIGVPFNRHFPIPLIKVRRLGNAPVSWDEAIANGWIMPGVWMWQPAGGFHRLDAGDITQRKLIPFEGYYVFTPQERGIYLVFDPALATRLTGPEPPLNRAWTMNLKAATFNAYDDDNAFGAVSQSGGALPVPAGKPPMASARVTLSFLSSGSAVADSTRAGAQSGWADSFLAFGAAKRWKFVIDGAPVGHLITLTWNNGRNLPVNLTLVLVDEATGKRVTMVGPGAVTSYAFNSQADPRRFRIEGN